MTKLNKGKYLIETIFFELRHSFIVVKIDRKWRIISNDMLGVNKEYWTNTFDGFKTLSDAKNYCHKILKSLPTVTLEEQKLNMKDHLSKILK